MSNGLQNFKERKFWGFSFLVHGWVCWDFAIKTKLCKKGAKKMTGQNGLSKKSYQAKQ